MFGKRNKNHAENSSQNSEKYFSFYKVIGSMIEVISFDTRNLLPVRGLQHKESRS